MADLDFRILGSLEVLRAGEPVSLGGLKQRAVLVLLLLNANRLLTADAIVDALWPVKRPGRPLTAVQGYVSGLRRTITPGAPFEVITTVSRGYCLNLEPEALDLHRFETRMQRGRRALEERQFQTAFESLAAALDLYRGAPLADFASEQWARLEAGRLEELRLACQEDRIEAGLALGRHRGLVGELENLIAAHPLRERLRGQLMLALYRSGRQSEALAAYRSVQETLAGEFGLEPTQALKDLERAVLRQDPSLELDLAEPTSARRLQTLLFTDIEGSTRLVRRLGEGYGAVLVEHRRLLREAAEAHGGRVVDSYGDGFFAAFVDPSSALAAAAGAQLALASYPWPERSSVKVRMGVHTGEPVPVGSGLTGLDVHRVARVCAAAHGGQVLVSEATAEALGSTPAGKPELLDLGEHLLRDIAQPELLFQLVVSGLREDFPPPRVDSPPSIVSSPDRAILLVGERSAASSSLIGVGETLARSHSPHELIVARLIETTAGSSAEAEETLARVTAELFDVRMLLGERGVTARVAAFTTTAAGEDAGRLAGEQAVDLLLTGRSAGELDVDELDHALVGIFDHAPCHVAVCVTGSEVTRPSGETVLVPFGGAEHDWAALELGAWIAGATAGRLRLLGSQGDPALGKRDASRLLASASLAVQQIVGVPTEPELAPPGVEAMLRAVEAGELVVAGVPSDWRAKGLGEVRRALVRAGAPAIFVRRGVRPGGLAPRGSQTRFSWSIADVAG